MINKQDFSYQIQLLQKLLKSQKIEALLVTDPYNVRYLSNFTGTHGQLLITPKKAFFLTDFRYVAVAKKILPDAVNLIEMKKGLQKTLQEIAKKMHLSKISFEAKNLTYLHYKNLKKGLSPLKFEPSENLVENLRMVKSDAEMKLIKKAQQITEKIFLLVRQNLKTGMSELDIAKDIEERSKVHGADCVSFPPIVAFNENCASPHHQPGPKKLKKGDVILIDMGMQYQGYCSDMTRMIFTKPPTPKQKEIYNLVLEAQQQAMQKLKANVKGSQIDQIARNIIEKGGYGNAFGHSLGHGVGLEVHENPSLSPNYHQNIPENSIVTVEPGIYIENFFGVRIEDMVLIKSNKIVPLTTIPKNIEESIFPIS
jgi:Xaa-Pro aminopeptidase